MFLVAVVFGDLSNLTPHPTPYTLHPTPYTQHSTPSTLNPQAYNSGQVREALAAPQAARERVMQEPALL